MSVETPESHLRNALYSGNREDLLSALEPFTRDYAVALKNLSEKRVIPQVISDTLGDLTAITNPDHPDHDFMTKSFLIFQLKTLRGRIVKAMFNFQNAESTSFELLFWQNVTKFLYPDFDFENI